MNHISPGAKETRELLQAEAAMQKSGREAGVPGMGVHPRQWRIIANELGHLAWVHVV